MIRPPPRRDTDVARGLFALLVGLLATLALIVSGAGPAAAQNAVGPQPVNSILTVGAHQAAGQENSGVRGPPPLRTASATGVAADDGAGDLAGATCGGESFTPDTNVVMADGSTKPLDEVKVGEKVQATDPKTGKTSAQTVNAVWVNHDTDLMDVTVKAGGKTSTVQATQHHLFWDATRKAWVGADQLVAGDQLRTDDGSRATVIDTVVVPGSADMWDLTVTNDHDFYVVTTTADILVHNCPIDMGKQGKHIPGHNNYIPGRSVLSADPSALDAYAGTGQQVGTIARGSAGFRERVNFGFDIGTYVDQAGNAVPTANGIFHYAADGTYHVVPARP